MNKLEETKEETIEEKETEDDSREIKNVPQWRKISLSLSMFVYTLMFVDGYFQMKIDALT